MKDFAAGLYVSKAVESVKCPYCKAGFAYYYLREGGGHYYSCTECGNTVEISSKEEEYCRRIELTQEDAEELYSFVSYLGGIKANKLIRTIQERHRKAIQDGKE